MLSLRTEAISKKWLGIKNNFTPICFGSEQHHHPKFMLSKMRVVHQNWLTKYILNSARWGPLGDKTGGLGLGYIWG
jgi:hypothetical protein